MRRRRESKDVESNEEASYANKNDHDVHNDNNKTSKKRRRPFSIPNAGRIPIIVFTICIASSLMFVTKCARTRRHRSANQHAALVATQSPTEESQPVLVTESPTKEIESASESASEDDNTIEQTMEPTPSPRAANTKRKFHLPAQEMGDEPNEYKDSLQAFDEKVAYLQEECEEALLQSGPVWVQTKDSMDWIKYRSVRARRYDGGGLIFDEMEFEDGIYMEAQGHSFEDWPYYAFDDDSVRTSGEESYLEGCRRTSVNRLRNMTCNKIHEHDLYSNLLEQLSKYLGSGAYRDAFLIPTSSLYNAAAAEDIPTAIFKSNALSNDDYDYSIVPNMEMSRLDALVMDLLSQSPRISNIYGYCSLAVMSEYCPSDLQSLIIYDEWYDGEELPDLKVEPTSRNNLTVSEKLELALEFAKPLADLHGLGLMHVDVKPDQFRRGSDSVVKLVDFNRAEVLLYDEEEEEYCQQNEGGSFTIHRAPEELEGKPQDDKADVYNYGSIVYTVLTGLWPHSGQDEETVREDLINGHKPFYDKRFISKSYGEASLIWILDEAWNAEPEERPDIFWIIDYLEEAIEENAEIEARGTTEDEWKEYLASVQNIER